MEHDQELTSLDKTIIAGGFEESSPNEPVKCYKVIGNAGTEEVEELLSHSEDEFNLSHGGILSSPMPTAKSLIPISDEKASKVARLHPSQKAALPRSKPGLSTKLTGAEALQALEKDYRHLEQAYDDTRRDLKSSSRENREQSLELRDLKRRIAKYQEQNAQLRDENASLREAYQAHQARGDKLSKSEKSKYNEHFEMLENHVSHLQHELHKRETHMEFLTEQTREANDGRERLEAEMRRLQRQTRDLSANLTECRDDLLRLQPTSQVSDNEISEQFSNVDQQIAGWVDDKTEDTTALEEKIGGLKTVNDLPELLRRFATSDHLRLAKKYPNSQPLLLRYFIHCYLQTFILSSNVYLFGLDARNIALLQGMEEGMNQLEPRRDEKTLRNWRAETLRGLLNIPTFISEQTRQANLASETLSNALRSFISPSPDSHLDPSELHHQIILPTVQLATKLRLSTTDYRLLFHPFTRDPSKATTVYHFEIPNSSMLDLTTHKVIRPDSILKVADDGRIGEEMLVVSPALVRDQRDGKGKVMVCKPTVLVKLDEPMGKRSRGIRALGAWTPSWFGGDEGVE